MKKVLKVLGVLVLLVLLAGGGAFVWAGTSSARSLDRTITTHAVDFPIPFPLDSTEIAALGLDPEEAEALALERAVERGEHLIRSRYACVECHGQNLAGGTMIDAPVLFRLFGPNLTGGPGSRIAQFTTADWDRIVRHGVFPDGKPAAMPSGDFKLMSDQELSDVIAYIRSLPPVDNQVPARELGPMGKVLMATGQIKLSADEIESHDAPHATLPPAADTTIEFGAHLAGVCTGCHSPSLAGGKIAGGDPSWPAAANLTPAGIGDWTYEQFVTALREARRPDGTTLLPPMDGMVPFAQRMTDVELQALWMYLRSLPATPTPDA
jgi:mono/diheme cytochrome c family protein